MLRNVFREIGISEGEIDRRIDETFRVIFLDRDEKFYFETPDGTMAYFLDTGNIDARTEGMSYGMMMAVQMNRQDIFNKLWLFSKTYMYNPAGRYEGYFAWSVKPTGQRNADGPAPDGEEYFAMALFFASARWGEGEPPFDYAAQARDILRHCLHQDEIVPGGQPMWNRENHLIKFVPEADFSDPSYHLPHFYTLFGELANEADRPFWKEAARASRDYMALACHPVTGMASEYAEYDGTPKMLFGKKMQFYSDAYRVAMNIGLDAAWFGKTPGLTAAVDQLQTYLARHTALGQYDSYLLDGTPVGEPAMHPLAVIATTAAGSLAAENPDALQWVQDFWNQPPRKGVRRYYDNCLYFFCLLMLSGRYRYFLPSA